MTADFKPKIFVRSACPFCIRLENYFEQLGLLEKFEVIHCDANGEEDLNRYRAFLTEKLGQRASFPAMEIAPGRFMSDSGALMAYYSELYNTEQSAKAI